MFEAQDVFPKLSFFKCVFSLFTEWAALLGKRAKHVVPKQIWASLRALCPSGFYLNSLELALSQELKFISPF